MNAAFLLVTSAMFVGQGGDKKVEPIPPPAAGKPAVVASSCGSDCCESQGHRFRDRMRGLFNRDCRDNCQPTQCCEKQRHSLFRSNCDDCGRQKIWNWNSHCQQQNCAPQTCNDPCNQRGLGFLGKLRGGFHRNDQCCDGGCNTVVAPIKAGEKIEPPKKMPVEPKKEPEKRPNQVNISVPPQIVPGTIPQVPSAPSVEVVPAPIPAPVAPPVAAPTVVPNPPVAAPTVPTPRVEGSPREPF